MRLRLPANVAPAFVAAGAFLLCWGLIHQGFYADRVLTDIPTYANYGAQMRAGHVPYRDFRVEYPPGALPTFVAPAFSGGYESAFGWLMAACGVGMVFVVAAGTSSRAALAFVAVSPLLVGSLDPTRYDLWPTFLLAAALVALAAARHKLGFGLLAAATAAKAFPIVVLPIALVWVYRRKGARATRHGALFFVGVLALIVSPFVALSPGGLWQSVAGQFSRPLQIETLPAAVAMWLGHPAVANTHGSFNLIHLDAVAACFTAFEAIALVALWLAITRGPIDRARFLQASAASVAIFVAFGKVLSPQYLIWLVPLVALLSGRRAIVACGLLAGAFALTLVFFPRNYFPYVEHGQLAWVVVLRDLVLVALALSLSFGAAQRSRV